jgi:hypothetical protein
MREKMGCNNDLYTLLVDTIGNVQNLHHRDFEQAPAMMAENVRQLSAGVYRLGLDLLVVLDVDRVLDAERLMKTSRVVLKRQKPLVEKKVETKDVASETTAIEDEGVEDEAALKSSAPKKDNVVPVKKAKELEAPAATGALFERICGDAAIEAAGDPFYGKVVRDAYLKPFFDGVNMD